MTTRFEMLELATKYSSDKAVDRALYRYHRSSTEMVEHASVLGSAARAAQERGFNPHTSPMLDTSQYTTIAIKLATAERLTWEALFDLACALGDIGVEVEW